MNSNLRLEWGIGVCSVQSSAGRRSKVGEDMEVRKKAKCSEEAHYELITEGKR